MKLFNSTQCESIILNYENELSVCLNKAAKTKVTNNIILISSEFDARYRSNSISIIDNIMHYRIKSRDGAFVLKKITTLYLKAKKRLDFNLFYQCPYLLNG